MSFGWWIIWYSWKKDIFKSDIGIYRNGEMRMAENGILLAALYTHTFYPIFFFTEILD